MFFHFETVTTADGTTQTVYQHPTMEEAVSAFHYTLYYQMQNNACLSALAMVFDDNGAVHKSEKYVKPAEE